MVTAQLETAQAFRLLVLVVLLWVGFDLSSPVVEGAFSFDPTESVDCARDDVRPDLPVVVSTVPAVRPQIRSVVRSQTTLPSVASPSAALPRPAARSGLPTAGSPSSDDD
jgi:hypothetical protein